MTAPKSRLKDPKVCRIFFSSPFNGMEGEREALTKLYWPRIQSLCSSKGIQFVPVDMRWGITSEMADNAQTINICLREADRSDMFVGFYGQRYGWFGAEDEALQRNFDVASAQYPWVDAYRDRSVTELEFLHGHLNNPGQLPAVICFRDKAFDDKLRLEAEEKDDKKGTYKFSSESELATARMDDLKKRVKESETKCLAVHMNYTDPDEGAKLMFDAMWEHLTEEMLKDTETEKMSLRQSDLLLHNALCDAHSGLYVGGDKNYGQLNQMTSDPEKPVILITGEAGCGKSALLANWVKQRKEQTDSDDILIYHFVGSTNESMDGKNILQRLVGNLRYELNPEDGDKDETYTKLMDEEIWDLVQKLQEAMQQAVEKKTRNVIFIVDGLNQIVKQEKIAKPMYWCPPSFPRGVHIVFSTQTTDTDKIEELSSTHSCQTLVIEPLTDSDRQEICKETLLLRGKELSMEQLAMMMQSENTTNPLYLTILLEELCMFGRFRELSKKIETLVSSKTATDLFSKYLERLESDYNTAEYEGNMVEKVMGALFLSRQGLTETELTSMFNIPSHLWSPLYFSLEKYLVKRQGFLTLVHNELKSAIESRYLTESDKRNAGCRQQIDYFYAERLRRKRAEEPIDLHLDTELPWLCRQAEQREELLELLVNPEIFQRLFVNQRKYELLSYWQYLEADQETIIEKLFKAIDVEMIQLYCEEMDDWREVSNPAAKGVDYLNTVQMFLSFAHFHKANEKVLGRLKKIFEVNTKFDAKYKEDEMARTTYELACLYSHDGRIGEALPMHLACAKFYEERIQKEGLSEKLVENLSTAYHGSGTAYVAMGMLEESEQALTNAITIYSHLSLPQTSARIHKTKAMLAQVHEYQGKVEQAVREQEELIKVQEELYFGTLPLEVAYTLSNLGICYRKLEMFDKAQEAYDRALKIKVNAVGEVHFDVAITYINLGNLAMNMGDLELMATYSNKAIDIYEQIGQGDGEDACLAHGNLCLALAQQERIDEAEPHFWKIFDYLVRENSLGRMQDLIENFMRHFGQKAQYEEARRVILPVLTSDIVSPDHFYILAAIDDQERAAAGGSVERVQRPYEYSFQRAADTFPDDMRTVFIYAEQQLIPAKDLETINQRVQKYHDATYDESERLVVFVGESCVEAGWISGAIEFWKKWLADKFDDSEAVWSRLSEAYSEAGDHNKALECMKRAQELMPDSPEFSEKVAVLALRCDSSQLDTVTKEMESQSSSEQGPEKKESE